MPEDTEVNVVKPPAPTPPAAPPDADLSEQVSAMLEKRAGETIRCVRVFDNHYRCNWWVHQDHSASRGSRGLALEVATRRIARSSFLTVKKTPDGLKIDGITSPVANADEAE